MPSELTGRFLPCNLFLVLAKNVLFLCTSIDRGVHNERQGPKSYTICTAVPSTFPTILPSLSKEMEPRLGSIGIYYYLYICTTTYKMQSKKILLIHVQSILELIITFHTCFFSLFSLSPSSGSLQLIEGVSVDGNQLYTKSLESSSSLLIFQPPLFFIYILCIVMCRFGNRHCIVENRCQNNFFKIWKLNSCF